MNVFNLWMMERYGIDYNALPTAENVAWDAYCKYYPIWRKEVGLDK